MALLKNFRFVYFYLGAGCRLETVEVVIKVQKVGGYATAERGHDQLLQRKTHCTRIGARVTVMKV